MRICALLDSAFHHSDLASQRHEHTLAELAKRYPSAPATGPPVLEVQREDDLSAMR
jgi:hypothetical protein